MPVSAHRPKPLVGRVFLGGDAVRRGWLTPRQLQGPSWRQLFHGVYADATLPLTPQLRIAAARLILPAEAVMAGRSAALLWGADGIVSAVEPVEVLVEVGHRFGPVSGLRIHTVNSIPAADIDAANGLRSTSAVRTALDLARWAPNLTEAVVLLDAMLSCGAVRLDRLRAHAATLSRGRGVAQVRRAVRLADGRSESPQESRMRMALVLGALPMPEPQYEVRHARRFVARVDLAYPDHRLAIEYDGRWHDNPHQFAPDRRRLKALAAAGWRVIPVTAGDLHDVDRLVATVRIALLEAA